MTVSPIWRPYTQHALSDPPIFIERAKGATLYAKGGRKFFDAISSWWVNLHGHAHPAIARAVARQAASLEQVIFAVFTHGPAEVLAKKLLGIAPRELRHVFLSDDGSTAVEVALKMALGYWRNQGNPKTLIVALEHAYHGDTFGAMSVSARGSFSASYDQLLFETVRLPFPQEGKEDATIAAFKRLLTSPKGKSIAALIVEPLVLGAGGMLMYGPEVLRELSRLCRRHGVFLIADEVMTGFGRTGRMFASDLAGISPDILCLSKGITGGFLPLGATLATEKIFRGFYSQDRAKTFFHGHSYTANPIACAAAVANLEIFDKEPVWDRVRRIAEVHCRRLGILRGHAAVSEVRQTGTIAAVELKVKDGGYFSRLGPRLSRFFLSRGVLLRPLGNVVYLIPPYCSTEVELNRAYDAIEESLSFR